MNISVIGLGKLGLCSAACFAGRGGHEVTGVDTNPAFIEALSARSNPIQEPGLDAMLESAWPRFSATADICAAVSRTQMSFIIVPTPSMADGRFTNEYIEAALRAMAPALAAKDSFHVVDIVSTVMPGSCEKIFRPMLERLTGKTCGRDFGLVYNPEFIALGSVIENFLNPDMVLIGASDERSAALVRGAYEPMCQSRPRYSLMSLANAEITKLSLNCFVTMKISFANELAGICENVPGADIDEITAALGADTRIGSKYLRGGLGFGGPCFPRDNIAFQAFAAEHGAPALLGPQVVAINRGVVERLLGRVSENTPPAGKVAVLGLSYKAGTHITDESQSVMLANRLSLAGYGVSVHDPKALATAPLADGIARHDDAYACTAGAKTIVLMTDWPEYARLDWNRIRAAAAPGAVVIDSWRRLRNKDTGMQMIAVGTYTDTRAKAALL